MSDNRTISVKKHIALIAHDHKKKELIEWVDFNKEKLRKHQLYGTGTTGKMIEKETGLSVKRMKSGPMGGDLQIGAMVAGKEIDILIFFSDPMEAQPHDPDVRALVRICNVWNVPIANNRSTADFLISSPLFEGDYKIQDVNYDKYMNRDIRK